MNIKNKKKRSGLILIVISLLVSNCIQVRASDFELYNYNSIQTKAAAETLTLDNDQKGETEIVPSEQTQEKDETTTVDNVQSHELDETSTEDNKQTDEKNETATEDNEQIETEEVNEPSAENNEQAGKTATPDNEKKEESEKTEVPKELAVEDKELESIVVPSVEIKEEKTFAIPQNLKASLEEGKIKIEWDSVEGALGYDLLINDTLISDIDESPYYYDEISDESEYNLKIRAKFSENVNTISTNLETKHVEILNETASVNSLTDSSENRIPSEWSSVVSVTATATAGTRVSGNISADTYWSAKNSPYIVTGRMEIA